jgi:hypothetical protein
MKVADFLAELDRRGFEHLTPEGAELLGRLRAIFRATAGADRGDRDGYFVGDASEHGVEEQIANGRAQWRWAHEAASDGIDALARGDLEAAALFGAAAETHRATAVELLSRARIADPLTGEQMRGRKPKAKPEPRSKRKAGRPTAIERDLQILAAVDAAKDAGWRGSQAVGIAKRDDPDLFAGLNLRGIREAMARAKKM